MKDLYFEIKDEIFQRFPGYVRGVVVAHDVRNGFSPAELIDLLRRAEVSLRQHVSLDGLAGDPRLKAWREAYRSFGAKPSEFRSSIEALARRVLRDNALPAINTLVDIGTVVSLNHVLPVGGHAIDVLKDNMTLGFATGNEQFIAFGSEAVEHPQPGEVVFVEGNQVLTRRWTWRQANHTLILPESTAVEINVDGLPPIQVSEVEQACDEVAALVKTYCSGSIHQGIVSQDHPRIQLLSVPE